MGLKYKKFIYALDDKNGVLSDEWSFSLSGLFVEIKNVMLNDKDKFKKAFKETEGSKLMFKISDNFEDKIGESIYKILPGVMGNT